nr:glycosyltransferase [Tianweitania aestuarii]
MLSTLSSSGGGRETWISQFVPHFLNSQNATIEVASIAPLKDDLVLKTGPALSVESVWPWPRYIPWPFLFSAGYIYGAKRSRDFDVVVAIGGLSEALPVVLANLIFRRRSRSVLWVRTVYLREKANRIPRILRAPAAFIEKHLVRRFDIVIANGDDTAAFYRNYREDVLVIANAVDVRRWGEAKKVYSGGPLHVSFIGRVTDIKGIREFVAAANMLQNPDSASQKFRFTVLGPCTENVKKQLGFLEPSCAIEYLPPLPNASLPSFLKTVDVCVNLTYGTGDFMGGGVSNALLEQMAAGKPQIVWDNPIYRNVTDEGFAMFARERDVQSLTACLDDLWQKRSDLPAMSENAMRRAQGFGWESHISRASDAFFGARTFGTPTSDLF